MTAGAVIAIVFAYAVIAAATVCFTILETDYGYTDRQRARWLLAGIFWPSLIFVAIFCGLRALARLIKAALPERNPRPVKAKQWAEGTEHPHREDDLR